MSKDAVSFKPLNHLSDIKGLRSLLLSGKTAWIVLALGLLATLWAWYVTHEAAQEKERLRFDFRVQETENAILKRMQDYEQLLRGASGLFAASQSVVREEWNAYINSLKIEERYPGIQAVGFSQWIPAEQLDAHVQQVRAQGFPTYSIKPPGVRPQYTPIIFIEPFEGRNRFAFGYDMFSESVRRRAMERARDSGLPTLSGKVTLIQETNGDVQAGTLLFLPVYTNGMPQNTPVERRAALSGFVYGAFRVDDFMSGVLGREKADARTDIDLEVFDGTRPSRESVLYDDDTALHAMEVGYKPMFEHSSVIDIQGATWTLYFSTLTPFKTTTIDMQKPAVILTIGVMLSFLLFKILTLRKKVEDDLRRFNEALEVRIKERTHQLELASKELESFSYSIAHDLRTPLRALSGFSQVLADDYANELDDTAKNYLKRIQAASQRMGQLIDDLLKLSRVARTELQFTTVDLRDMVEKVHAKLQHREPERTVTLTTPVSAVVQADPRLLEIAIENLLNNAWKFTRKTAQPGIEFGKTEQAGETVYFIRDNGVGFDMSYVNKLFKPFERLHSDNEFEGTGIGLSIVSRIITRHGGRVWAEGHPGDGATFYFTLAASSA